MTEQQNSERRELAYPKSQKKKKIKPSGALPDPCRKFPAPVEIYHAGTRLELRFWRVFLLFSVKISEGGMKVSSDNGDIMTVKEAANRLNLSERTIWKYIQNRSLKTSRKFSGGKKPMVMVFEKSISELLRTRNIEPSMSGSMNNPEQDHNASGKVQDASELPFSIPLHHYEEQRSCWLQERDNLQAGLMMYRWKFEDLERQVKLLPAPAETIGPRLTELEQTLHDREQALTRAEEILKKAREDYDLYKTSIVELKEKLQEEERVKADLRRELEMERRPWWKKVIGLK
jgi:excisionase family DNA binding protein